jgi:hypothetical protein
MDRQIDVTVAALESGNIDAEAFDHEAHVYAAWLFLDAYPAEVASERFAAALKRLTEKLGVPGKYHDTVTRFYMALIAERRAASNDLDWSGFRESNRDLFGRSDNVLSRYYSRERLASDEARRAFVLPDRLP